MTQLDIFRKEKDKDHFWARYRLKSTKNLKDAAYNLAVGQSIGNPNARSTWETPEMVERHCAKIIEVTPFNNWEGEVLIGFPNINLNWYEDGVSQLLCMLMGGQMDIDSVTECHLLDLEIDDNEFGCLGPAFGLTGFRSMTKCFNKPLFGGIIKPKTGMNPEQLLEMVKQLIDGGVNFIKEDEILGSPFVCDFDERAELIHSYFYNNDIYNVVYTFCINGDNYVRKAQKISKFGMKNVGVHLNVWSGLGGYNNLRYQVDDLFMHYQKSGDRTFTNPNHAYHIDWRVLCKIATLSGVDTIHAGMWGGYSNSDEDEITDVMKILRDGNVCPALSCGMTAVLIPKIAEKFGVDWMANVGGAIHSDEEGTTAGALKIRKAIDSL